MNAGARRVQRVYLVLLLLHTLAASFIWGTLFLLDAALALSFVTAFLLTHDAGHAQTGRRRIAAGDGGSAVRSNSGSPTGLCAGR